MVNLFELRKNLRLSQKDMADELNMGRSTYIKYETGEKNQLEIESNINELMERIERRNDTPVYEGKHLDSKDICTEDLIELKVIADTTQHGLTRINKMIEKLIGKK